MKSYIIHLPDVEESARTARALRDQLAMKRMQSELFEGTRGDAAVKMMEVEGRTVHPWGIKGPDVVQVPDEKAMAKIQRPGVKGCFYSHYNLWRLCASLNEPIIIWEDDIIIHRAYEPVEFQDVLILALGHPKKSADYMNLLENPQGPAAALPYHRTSMPGCCGYAIKPHAARVLVNAYRQTYLPADNAVNQYYVRIQIHSHVLGIAQTKKEGKKSLTSASKFWGKQ